MTRPAVRAALLLAGMVAAACLVWLVDLIVLAWLGVPVDVASLSGVLGGLVAAGLVLVAGLGRGKRGGS